MIQLIQNISGWISTLGEYIASSVKGFGYLLGIIIQSLAIPPMLRPYIPSFLGIAITAVVLISVIKAIFGR